MQSEDGCLVIHTVSAACRQRFLCCGQHDRRTRARFLSRLKSARLRCELRHWAWLRCWPSFRPERMNLGQKHTRLFHRTTHARVKLAFEVDTVADLVQRIVDDAKFVSRKLDCLRPVLRVAIQTNME